jgi:hypothetical protein
MKNKNDPFDLEKFRLSPEDMKAYAGKAAPRSARRPASRQFTIVPRAWSDRLEAARYASTYKLALHLLHQDWKNGGRRITLANAVLTNAGVSRGQKWRALRELERLKLIEIERRRRKSPLVTLLKTNEGHHGTQSQ